MTTRTGAPRKGPATPTARGLTLDQVWAIAAILLPLLIVTASPMGTVDLAYHLRVGAEIVATRAIPEVDSFTFTAAGRSWFDQQWLSQVLLATAFDVGGWFALALFRSLLAASALLAILVACRAQGAERRTSAWLTLGAAALLLPTLQLRPQLFGVVCFAVALWLLAGRHQHPMRVWWLVTLVAAWSNLHGTFFLAVGLIGLAWLADVHANHPRRHRLIAVGLTVIAATMLNPFGPQVWRYVWSLSSNQAVRGLVVEWQPTSFDSYSGAGFLLSVLLVAFHLVRWRTRVTWPLLLALTSFILIGLSSVRGVYWWGMAAPVLMAGTFAGTVAEPLDRPTEPQPDSLRMVNLAVVAVLVCALLASLSPWLAFRTSLPTPMKRLDQAPAGITAALERTLTPRERVFAAQAWGSWFEFALPAHPVAVDSRIELFPASVWTQYTTVASGREGWHEQLEAWTVRVVAVHAAQQPRLLQRLVVDRRWQQVYRDDDGAVFVRR
jgi:hypothetical protein